MTQSVSRTSKPIGFYVSNEAIDALARACGDYLEKLTAQQKCLLLATIADHMAGDSPNYGIVESLCCIDPDKILTDSLWQRIESIATDSTAIELAGLQCALAAQISDHAAAGDFE